MLQLQATAMIYVIVAAVSIFDAAANRREQRSCFALSYRQVLTKKRTLPDQSKIILELGKEGKKMIVSLRPSPSLYLCCLSRRTHSLKICFWSLIQASSLLIHTNSP